MLANAGGGNVYHYSHLNSTSLLFIFVVVEQQNLVSVHHLLPPPSLPSRSSENPTSITSRCYLITLHHRQWEKAQKNLFETIDFEIIDFGLRVKFSTLLLPKVHQT